MKKIHHVPVHVQVLRFRLAQCVEVAVSMGDVSEERTQGIVNWTDGKLTHQVTPCSQKMDVKSGTLIRNACKDYIQSKGKYSMGCCSGMPFLKMFRNLS